MPTPPWASVPYLLADVLSKAVTRQADRDLSLRQATKCESIVLSLHFEDGLRSESV